jgi:predicted nucleic acid-binding Zn ribbon protein
MCATASLPSSVSRIWHCWTSQQWHPETDFETAGGDGMNLMAPQPRHIGDILSGLMARRGYARIQSGGACAAAWREAVGEAMANCTRATQVRRGVLEVLVGNSTMVQEIGFRKAALIKRLVELLPDEKIHDLKLRVGPIT